MSQYPKPFHFWSWKTRGRYNRERRGEVEREIEILFLNNTGKNSSVSFSTFYKIFWPFLLWSLKQHGDKDWPSTHYMGFSDLSLQASLHAVLCKAIPILRGVGSLFHIHEFWIQVSELLENIRGYFSLTLVGEMLWRGHHGYILGFQGSPSWQTCSSESTCGLVFSSTQPCPRRVQVLILQVLVPGSVFRLFRDLCLQWH